MWVTHTHTHTHTRTHTRPSSNGTFQAFIIFAIQHVIIAPLLFLFPHPVVKKKVSLISGVTGTLLMWSTLPTGSAHQH